MRVHIGAVVALGSAALVMMLGNLPPSWGPMDADDVTRWLLFVIVLGVWRIVATLDGREDQP